MRRVLKIAAVVVAAVLAGLALWLFGSWGDPDLSASPSPANDYAAAIARIDAVKAADAEEPLADRGRSYALVHGSRVATSVVILHGYTSAPKPFRAIAQAYYEAGYNVWVPRAPAHGYADYFTDAHARITATHLRDYADDAVDVASGLGEHVVVVGQSGGGALAMWAVAERPEVVRAVAISPFLHPKSLPTWQMRPLGRAASVGLLRGMWRWWDPVLKDSPRRQVIDPNAYPRASVNALMEYLTVGRWLRDTRTRGPRPAGDVVLVVNEHDPEIDGRYNLALARELVGASKVTRVVVPDSEGLGHDLVDPQGENRARIRSAYRYLDEATGVDASGQLPGSR